MADAFIDIRELDANTLRDISVKSGVIWPMGLAMDAYRVADAMMKVREGGTA